MLSVYQFVLNLSFVQRENIDSKEKTVKMISHIKKVIGVLLSDNDIESILSVNDKINEEITRALQPLSHGSDS